MSDVMKCYDVPFYVDDYQTQWYNTQQRHLTFAYFMMFNVNFKMSDFNENTMQSSNFITHGMSS